MSILSKIFLKSRNFCFNSLKSWIPISQESNPSAKISHRSYQNFKHASVGSIMCQRLFIYTSAKTWPSMNSSPPFSIHFLLIASTYFVGIFFALASEINTSATSVHPVVKPSFIICSAVLFLNTSVFNCLSWFDFKFLWIHFVPVYLRHEWQLFRLNPYPYHAHSDLLQIDRY